MSTQSIELTVNGEIVRANVEPRMHLGDFVRRELGLTGTHLSCEHGVCGACTVLIDGSPQRSCITFAIACSGSDITTIEGYGDDPLMTAIRQAFHEHHALQCGYCTPGMLCTARDIVLRLPGPDARRVRHELAGNLCRCTGYVGIVEAIDSVLARKAAGTLTMPVAPPVPRTDPASVAACASATPGINLPGSVSKPAASAARAAAGTWPSDWQAIDIPADADWVEVRQSLRLPLAAQAAWRELSDLERVASCLPGASITRHAGDRAEGVMNIRFGPITAAFAMRAELSLDSNQQQGHMRAEGVDQRSSTRVKTLLDYQVIPDGDSNSTVALQLRFRLAGPLAQFSRTGLVNDYVAELTRIFSDNLVRRLSGANRDSSQHNETPSASPSILRLLIARLRRWLSPS